MLGKLIKYDLLADYKKYIAIYIAMLASSVMMLLFDKMTSWISNNTFVTAMAAVFALVYFSVCLVAGVMIMVLATVRFYKNVVRDEGYLTHTLPVPTWQIIASKLITVYICFFATLLVAVICSGIAFGKPLWLFKLSEAFSDEEFRAGFDMGVNASLSGSPVYYSGDEGYSLFAGLFKLYAWFMLLSPLMAMSSIYFSFSLGNLFNKSKLAMSVLMYFALAFGQSIIGGIASVFITPRFIAEAAKYGEEQMPIAIVLDFLQSTLSVSLVISVVLSIGFLIGAERIFAKKLNLE